MKQHLLLLLLVFFSFNSFGQIIIANDDAFNNVNSADGDRELGSPLTNDTFNGMSANPYFVVTTQVSTTNSGVFLDTSSFTPNIKINTNTAPGTYTIIYSICELMNLSNCDTATITVNVVNVPRPAIVSVTQPQCVQGSTGSITLGGLPATGQWTLNQYGTTQATFTGTGSTTTLNNLPVDTNYYFTVTNTVQNYTSSNSDYITIRDYKDMGYDNVIINALYIDSNSDGIKNAGDIVNYQLAVTNPGVCPMATVNVTNDNNPGLIISGSPIQNLQPQVWDTTTITATYTITQNDVNNGFVRNRFTVSPTWSVNVGPGVSLGFYPEHTLNIGDEGIRLAAFIDSNSNGYKDSWEQLFPFGYFRYEKNYNGIIHHINSSTGVYFISENNYSNVYALDYATDPAYPQYSFSGWPYSDISSQPGVPITYYFPVSEAAFTDLGINIFPVGAPPRPGFTYQNKIVYTNNGDQTIASGTLTFTKDNVVGFSTISQAGVNITATGFTYDFSNLAPHETREIIVEMLVPTLPIVSLGDLLTNMVTITVPNGDTTNNNSNGLTQIIVGAYDPNEKTENHGGKILLSTYTPEDYLTYTIHFENTGTGNASKVLISDILDYRIDPSSLKMIDASHAYYFEKDYYNLLWTFNNINLPPNGKGYVAFQVKLSSGVTYAIGDIIPNTASIYFDFNPAIVTNTCTTEFVSTMSVSEFNSGAFVAYPNPTKGIITIASKNNATIEKATITDVLGKTVAQQNLSATSGILDISSLKSGMYFLTVEANNQKNTLKIVKQ